MLFHMVIVKMETTQSSDGVMFEIQSRIAISQNQHEKPTVFLLWLNFKRKEFD